MRRARQAGRSRPRHGREVAGRVRGPERRSRRAAPSAPPACCTACPWAGRVALNGNRVCRATHHAHGYAVAAGFATVEILPIEHDVLGFYQLVARAPPSYGEPLCRWHDVGGVQIFISYRRDDTAGRAGRLFDALASRLGARNVFQDVTTIAPGGSSTAPSPPRSSAATRCSSSSEPNGPPWPGRTAAASTRPTTTFAARSPPRCRPTCRWCRCSWGARRCQSKRISPPTSNPSCIGRPSPSTTSRGHQDVDKRSCDASNGTSSIADRPAPVAHRRRGRRRARRGSSRRGRTAAS